MRALLVNAGVSHSAIYEKADTSKPDVKAIDINQKVAGQSQERGTTPLLYCCTADDLQGETTETNKLMSFGTWSVQCCAADDMSFSVIWHLNLSVAFQRCRIKTIYRDEVLAKNFPAAW